MPDSTSSGLLISPDTSYLLPEDVRIVPVHAYAVQLRQHLQLTDEQYVLVRDGSRSPAKAIDPAAAELLQCFRTANTIPAAVLDYAARTRTDPESLLAKAFALIRATVSENILVPADSAGADSLQPRFATGASLDGWIIEACIHLAQDSEVYEVRRGADHGALKIGRTSGGPVADRIAVETAILDRLAGAGAPRLLGRGTVVAEDPGGPADYLVADWVTGLPLWVAAAPWRGDASLGLDKLQQLMIEVVAGYAELHDRGVLHGDIHPDNVLVTPDERIMIIDFGQAAIAGPDGTATDELTRGLTIDFCAPETARAARDRRPLPAPTTTAEIYCVAALAHHLLAGTGPLELPPDLPGALAEIADGTPRSLADCGVRVSAPLQQVLRRALDPDPGRRPASLRRLADDLRNGLRPVEPPEIPSPTGPALPEAWAAEVLRAFRTYGPADFDSRHAPLGNSVAHGSAGVALSLLRLAQLEDDPWLLAQADSWATHAIRPSDGADAAWTADLPYPPEVATESLFYGEVGSLIVRALVSRGLGDEETELDAIRAVLSRMPAADAPTELMFGTAGYLLGLGLLLDGPTATGVPAQCRPEVVRTGRTVLDQLWQRLDALPAMVDCAEQGYLGQAHGWAGRLLASIRWCSLTGTASPDSLDRRLDELVDLGRPGPDGVRWPMHAAAARGPFRPGWCNGTAGLLHLWLEAAALTGRTDLAALADRTAEAVAVAEPIGDGLCCGAGGMAYALLAAHRQTGEQRWLSAARRLAAADPAARPADPAQHSSLYAGRLGAALLVRELAAPDVASAPLFGRA